MGRLNCRWMNGRRVFPIRDINPTRLTPIVTILFIIANVAVYFLWQPHGSQPEQIAFLYERAAVACEVVAGRPLTLQEFEAQRCRPQADDGVVFPQKSPYLSVLTSLFLHGGILHLLGNMWFLWLFGNNVEEAYGHIRYALVYLLAGIAATLGFIALQPENITPLVGASGAIAGVLGSYLVLFPTKMVLSLAFYYLLPVPAVIFLGLWFIGQFMLAAPGVAWEAHVAGFVFGAAVSLLFRGALIARVRRSQARAHRVMW